MALIYVWLRLSTMKQLDWHRGSSYQSKDIAHAQKTIAQRMADKVRAGCHLRNLVHSCKIPGIRLTSLQTASQQGGLWLLPVWA